MTNGGTSRILLFLLHQHTEQGTEHPTKEDDAEGKSSRK
jgi:hypothetical protein